MNDRQTRVLQSWRRIIIQRDTLSHIAPEAPAVLDRLAAIMDEIDMHAQQQLQARKSLHLTAARKTLDRMRTEQMLPLARLARRLFAGASDVESALRVPHKRAPTDDVIVAAETMVKALQPHRKLLGTSNIDPTRIDRLRSDTRILKKLFRDAYAKSADRAAPTRRLPALFAAARLEVDMLDALVGATGDKAVASNWKYLSRVGKRMGRPRRPRNPTNAK